MSSRKFRRGLAGAARPRCPRHLVTGSPGLRLRHTDDSTGRLGRDRHRSRIGRTARRQARPLQPRSPRSSPTAASRSALAALLSAGDYFEQWRAGAEAQAEELGITLDFLGADGDNDRHALNLQQAIDSEADAIIVDHGFPETIQPVIGQAVEAGIPVVAFDVDPGDHSVVTLRPERRGDRRHGARGARGGHRR